MVKKAKEAKGKARPPFKCFRTDGDNPNARIKCYWNEQDQKYNLNCQEVDVSECKGGA